jgi:hypothetical protein
VVCPPKIQSADSIDPYTQPRLALKRLPQLRRLPSLSIQPKPKTQSIINDGPCSLDVLIRWLELGNNFKTFRYGGKGKRRA